MSELTDRRSYSDSKIQDLQKELSVAAKKASGKACIYVTGSYGWNEASSHSDLDLFILGKLDDKEERRLNRLDEIIIKAELIEAVRTLGIRDFSGDGKYLEHFSEQQLTETLGTSKDDETNTFTARLLLLLESRPLLEKNVYEEAIKGVVANYWKDYEDHKSDFMPAFLANDFLRLWRTLCVNYEAINNEAKKTAETLTNKAERKLKNDKLKHSRILTCYSAILFLLAIYKDKNTVSPDDTIEMIALSPTQRFEYMRNLEHLKEAHGDLDNLIEKYERFLTNTNYPKSTLIENFQDKTKANKYFKEASEFGDAVYQALTKIGSGNNFYRLLVV